MAKLTFGKWQGWDTKDLAKFSDGRSYLEWGIVKLESPKWRQEFQAALDAVSPAEIDLELEAQSIMRDDCQIDANDAYILAQDYRAGLIESAERTAAYDAARQRFFNALSQAGIGTGAASVVFRMIEIDGIWELSEAEKLGRIKFSSPTKRNVVYQAAIEFDGDLDNII